MSSLDKSFKINVKLSIVDKPELLFVNNPNYEQLLRKHDLLRGVTMDDGDMKPQLPVYQDLGNGDYTSALRPAVNHCSEEKTGANSRKNKVRVGDNESWLGITVKHDALNPDFAIRL